MATGKNQFRKKQDNRFSLSFLCHHLPFNECRVRELFPQTTLRRQSVEE